MATWNNEFNQEPKGNRNPGSTYGPATIRDTRSEFQTRVNKEHLCNSTSTIDGFHREGSFKAYYSATEPQFRPDGTTELTSQDEGRKWVSSSDKSKKYWNGSSWTENSIGFPSLISMAEYYAQTAQFYSGSGWKTVAVELFEYNLISGVTIDGSGISLPIGKYLCKYGVQVSANNSSIIQFRLYNSTDSSVAGIGGSTISNDPGRSATLYCYGFAYLNLTVMSTIIFQTANGSGGVTELYHPFIRIWKVG